MKTFFKTILSKKNEIGLWIISNSLHFLANVLGLYFQGNGNIFFDIIYQHSYWKKQKMHSFSNKVGTCTYPIYSHIRACYQLQIHEIEQE